MRYYLSLILCLVSAAGEAQDLSTLSPTEWGLPQLMQNLAQKKSSQGKFVERKVLGLLNKPLESSGTISFQAPGHLEKQILVPNTESLVLDQGILTIEIKSRNIKRTLVLQEFPAVWALVESIRSTLAGDLPTLKRFYKITLNGNEARWNMQLRPIDIKSSELVHEIIISGHGNQVSNIEMYESNGDHSIMTVVEVTP